MSGIEMLELGLSGQNYAITFGNRFLCTLPKSAQSSGTTLTYSPGGDLLAMRHETPPCAYIRDFRRQGEEIACVLDGMVWLSGSTRNYAWATNDTRTVVRVSADDRKESGTVHLELDFDIPQTQTRLSPFAKFMVQRTEDELLVHRFNRNTVRIVVPNTYNCVSSDDENIAVLTPKGDVRVFWAKNGTSRYNLNNLRVLDAQFALVHGNTLLLSSSSALHLVELGRACTKLRFLAAKPSTAQEEESNDACDE